MRGKGILEIVLAVVIVALAVSVAKADRKPTSKERSTVAAVVDLPASCARVRMSTENESYASVSFKPKSSEKCQPLASDGVTIAKRKKGRWKFVTAGSDFGCEELHARVPEAVVEDLGVRCHSPPAL